MSYLSRLPISRLRYNQYKNLNYICTLCKELKSLPSNCFNSGISVRQQTTTTKSLPFLSAGKKLKKKTKKEIYSDVIQVSNSNGSIAKQKRTLVKKTTSKDLLDSLSLTKSDTASISEIKVTDNVKFKIGDGKTSSIIHNTMQDSQELPLSGSSEHLDLSATESQFFSSESLPITCMQFERLGENHESIVDANDELQEEEEVVNKSKKKSVKKTKYLSKEDRELTSKVKTSEKKQFTRQFLDKLTMAAYIDVCTNGNMINYAHKAVIAHKARLKGKSNGGSLEVDISVYNRLLQAQARKGNWNKAKELLFALRKDQIKPTLQTYIALFDCISRLPNKDAELISNILKDIQKDNLDINNIDKECVYIDDQRDRILKVIHLVEPHFVPDSITIKEPYTSSLLNGLEETTERFCSTSKRLSDVKQLQFNAIRQMNLEVDGYLTVKSIYKSPKTITDEKTQKMKNILEICETNWRTALTERFQMNMEALKEEMNRGKNMWNVNLYPFLSVMKPDEYVEIMMQEIHMLAETSETYSTPQSVLHLDIGNKVMQRYFVHTKEQNKDVKKILEMYKHYCQYQNTRNLKSSENPREYWTKLLHVHSKGPTLDYEDAIWPKHILSKVGKFLYNILLQETTFDPSLLKSSNSLNVAKMKMPAFITVYRSCNRNKYVKEDIRAHPVLLRIFRMAGKQSLKFSSTILPMIAPPLPWTSIRRGGYLLSTADLVRLHYSAALQLIRLEDTPNKQLWPIFDSLNQLSECAWKINKPILDVIIEVFNSNGDESLDIPPPPLDVSEFPTITLGMTREDKSKVLIQREMLRRRRAEMYSLWCDALYRLSIANHYKDETFWFSHNMDFRGRVYPCPPHFNHLGGDVARSLLVFSDGELLGEKGLDWLKIHLINLTGSKKRESVNEKLRYANEMMPEIIDSANNPLTGNRWWTKSDEPWQTLACCKEIVKASALPDPSKYICHFPIHQDGSCNGLQHYSALGRDALGAEQVNLLPKDKPEDVYTGVAQLVDIEREKDAANGVEIAQVLEGYVTRKVIKQTVMTTVYGVTRYGARLQILRQLKAIPDFPAEKHWEASMYLVQKTFQSLQKMFTATKEIQDWFTDCARTISSVCGQPIEWITPLGLPVVQPYHRPVATQFKFGPEMTGTESSDLMGKPNVMKQKNAFPPNFIHSLDSTHMMLTSLYCRQKGIAFVSVHDCFWTHPSTVEIMNKVCREQFVALHSLPLLHELSSYFVDKYSYSDNELSHDGSASDRAKQKLNKLLKRVPKTGDFQLENVLNSTYFFS
ncbi:hypothetical protein CHUAL_010254 [Chamberlinius hualienensis]